MAMEVPNFQEQDKDLLNPWKLTPCTLKTQDDLRVCLQTMLAERLQAAVECSCL